MKEKEIFRDCYNLLNNCLKKPTLDPTDWIVINETVEKMIHNTYAQDKDDQLLCAELITVVVDHINRKRCKK